MRVETAIDAGAELYDVVIVGAGIAGSIMAKALGHKGWKVLVLEAGTAQSLGREGYASNLERFYAADAKVPNAPYAANHNAPQPDVLDVKSNEGDANSGGYFVQDGRLPFRSDYVRQAGGTTLHWLGTCLRMVPQDFELWSKEAGYAEWPIGYSDLAPFYSLAEREIGVSADIGDQRALGAALGIEDWFEPDYQYPMRRIPPSHLDCDFGRRLKGRTFALGGVDYPLDVTSTPQGRNGAPNPDYPGGYVPVGAAGDPDTGQRCQGNSSCVPICPVQAKYNAVKSLAAGAATGNVRVVTQAVASMVLRDVDGQISGIEYKAYDDPDAPAHTVCVARGRQYVLAAHAVENVKLLLASAIGGPATGWYLMDHPVMLAWGLADRPLGTFRGPGSTSGIETMRAGNFRTHHSAFRVEIDNWGWNWATGAPWDTVIEFAWNQAMFGRGLRSALFGHVQRQVRFGFLMEVPPVKENRIGIDRGRVDALGNPRPVITFDLPTYTKKGMQMARRLSRELFPLIGAVDYTSYADGAGAFEVDGERFSYFGAGHVIGGHVMGSDPRLSVVDHDQRVWNVGNLWLIGSGNMASEGTSNPTLTVAALTLRAAEALDRELGR